VVDLVSLTIVQRCACNWAVRIAARAAAHESARPHEAPPAVLTDQIGLVKHLTLSEARYFGAIFNRPYPEPIPTFDDPGFEN